MVQTKNDANKNLCFIYLNLFNWFLFFGLIVHLCCETIKQGCFDQLEK